MKHHEQARNKSIEHIKLTALGLFSTQGFAQTSIRKIAKEAGISLGLLYNYFPSKEALLQAIFQQGLADIQASFVLEKVQNPKKRFANYVRQTFQMIQEKRAFWRLLHSIRMQSSIMTLLQTETELTQSFIIQQLSELLTDLEIPDTPSKALLLFATIDGISNHYLLDENYPIMEVGELLIQQYISKP